MTGCFQRHGTFIKKDKIMPMYKVSYGSMTATYGPSFIEADSPEEAKMKFGGTAFSSGERAICMNAREVSSKEIAQALRDKQNRREE
jgi:hypothetical protein